jgi:hypothetical protein
MAIIAMIVAAENRFIFRGFHEFFFIRAGKVNK